MTQMGKHTKKAKTMDAVPLMEVSPSSVGVLTRAKTLALQRRQSADSSKPSSCFLELRSRRLEKPPLRQNSRKSRRGCGCREPEAGIDEEGSNLGSIETGGLGILGSVGENDLASQARNRNSRESTPSNLIISADSIPCPASTRKQSCSGANIQRAGFMEVPKIPNWEKFFDLDVESQQRFFVEKYNFDIVNDKPLPGRYEWVRVSP